MEEQHQPLLPGLPDPMAELCLFLVPPSTLYSVCRSWRRLIYSPSFPPFLSLYVLSFSTKNPPSLPNPLQFSCFDPVSCKWLPLPPPPPDAPLRILFRCPSFVSRILSVQSVAVSGNLILLAATADQFLPALSKPLVFNSLTHEWALGPPFSVPRRWCVAGVSCGAVYMASGCAGDYSCTVARSVEKWDLTVQKHNHHDQRQQWDEMEKLSDVRFSREAMDAVGWKGKLCVVSVKGYYGKKDGMIYNIATDLWEEMPQGMLAGWSGPAAAMAEETIYVVDESRGLLKRYDEVTDAWVEVVESVMLIAAQQVVAAGGKVCVLCADGAGIVVVDVGAAPPARTWMVKIPAWFQAARIHILPRLRQ